MVSSTLSGSCSSFARRGAFTCPTSERLVFVLEKARSFARRVLLKQSLSMAKANLIYLLWQSFIAPGHLDFCQQTMLKQGEITK